MAKTSKKKPNDPISINTIYETMKDRNLVQELWMEVIPDIKDKPTYKRIKEMVRLVLNGTLSNFDTEPTDNAERLQRRVVFAEISIMAYTVDRMISEYLYRRLQNEFKSMIGNMLEELQTEKKAEDEPSPSRINSMLENIESIFTKKEQGSLDEGSVNIQQVEANPKPVRKRGRPKKSVNPSAPSSSVSRSSKIVETCEKSSESNSCESKDSDQDSNLTFNSLSSVHTTDLSSFDDNVSICTDDGKNGRRKKRVPLKKANSMIVEGRLSDIYKVETSVEMSKRKREVKSASRKVLPQRKRKPNSRYNAETMYCQVKDYSSPRDSPISEVSETSSSSEALEGASNEPEINQEAKRVKVSNRKNEDSLPTKPAITRTLRSPAKDSPSQNNPAPSSSSTPIKNSAQRYTSSELYKPRFHFGSSCNNRSATAFTIFSS